MKKQNHDFISIVIPCYNKGSYLSQALNSILAQDSNDWEVIIVDDGSTDKSIDIIEKYRTKFSNDQFLVLRQENSGVSKARNMGTEISNGDFILYLDADDWLSPSCVSEALTYMRSHLDCSVFRPTVEWHNETYGTTGKDHNYSTYRNMLLYGQNCQFVIRKSDWKRVGGFDENMKSGIEDWEFCIRLLAGENKVYNSSSILYHYRKLIKEGSLSQSAGKSKEEILWYIYKKHRKIYQQYFGNPIEVARNLESLGWTERRLPRLAHKMQLWWQKIRS